MYFLDISINVTYLKEAFTSWLCYRHFRNDNEKSNAVHAPPKWQWKGNIIFKYFTLKIMYQYFSLTFICLLFLLPVYIMFFHLAYLHYSVVVSQWHSNYKIRYNLTIIFVFRTKMVSNKTETAGNKQLSI